VGKIVQARCPRGAAVQTILPTLLIALGLLLPAAAAPPSTGLTAAFSPASPTVGVTKVTITGTATAGAKVIDTSTYPDGSIHIFTVKADAAGAYTDGPFVLQQLGTYRDVLRDAATGASTAISYSGTGDFSIAVAPAGATITTAEGDFSFGVDPAGATMRAGLEARLKVTFTSIGGFGGEVVPRLPAWSEIPGAAVTWSSSRLKVPPNGSATAILSILTLVGTTPRTYDIAPQGVSGSVTHALDPAVGLTVTAPPPGLVTAMFSPDRPVVGVTEVSIQGRASPGQLVVDTSTLPDGVAHDFVIPVTGAGTYTDGPFLLRQLGTYHDVILDGATGATVAISYQGVGDFSAAVDQASQTVARGEEAKFQVTFKSLSGFAGAVTAAVPDLSKIPEATAAWTQPAVTVRSGDSIATGLTIKTSAATPAGTYTITVQGTNGSVTHAVPSDVTLTVK
jgi:hypothetical protein